MTDDVYRVFSFGSQIAGPLSADELAELEAKIAANAACGLASPDQIVVERFDGDSWRVDHVLDYWTEPAMFTNPIAMTGGDDG